MSRLLPLFCVLSAPLWAQQPHATPAHHRTASAKPKAEPTVAYYCASGHIVKYHASPTCYGLEKCTSAVKPLPLRTAQARMEPCRVCH